LSVAQRIVATAAVTEGDVQESVGAEGNGTTVVVPERVRNSQDFFFTGRIGDGWVVF